MKSWLDEMTGVHSASVAYDPKTTGKDKYEGKAAITYRLSETIYEEVEHPVVRTHPETGRKSLFVNQMFTQRIVGLERAESAALLSFLYDHCSKLDFTCRFRWQPGSVAVASTERLSGNSTKVPRQPLPSRIRSLMPMSRPLAVVLTSS